MVIQKILFPDNDLLNEEMFFRGVYSFIANAENKIILSRNATLSSNTYFNSFSLGKWKRYTAIDSLDLLLKLKGVGIVNLYGARLKDEVVESTKLSSMSINSESEIQSYKINIDMKWDYTLIYFEIVAIDKIFFDGGGFETRNEGKKNIKLVIDICTYNRYPYLKKNIKNLNDKVFNNQNNVLYNSLEVVIVDNYNDKKTLQLATNKIHIFQQDRKGSAGGFARALLETCKINGATHCVIMDDDVFLYMPVIERLYGFLKFIRTEYNDALVGGALMRLDKTYIQYESGAMWNDGNIKSCNANRNILDFRSIIENEIEDRSEYLGWWLCCIPVLTIEKKGYPLPVYFHRDDVEFGLRNKKQITLNGVCTWHEPFEAKTSAINEYYNIRNAGIIMAAYHKKRYKYCYLIVKNIMVNLFLLKYNVVDLMLCGVEDFLRGAEWIIKNDSGDFYDNLRKKDFEEKELGKIEKQKIKKFLLEEKCDSSPKNKWIRYFFLNGNWKKSVKTAWLPSCNYDTALLWNVQEVYYYNQYTEKIFSCEKNRKEFFLYIMRMGWDIIKIGVKYGKVSREWRKNKELWTQDIFWQEKLN